MAETERDPVVEGGGEGPAPAAAVRLGWRKRHPVLARSILYGTLAAIGVTAWLLLSKRAKEDEEARQTGLVTLISGAELIRGLDPEGALKTLREKVLTANPDEHVRLKALLAEAATLDYLKRFDESEAAYGKIAAEWPASTPRGALSLPWANMRVRAGHAKEGLELLDSPGATAGESEADVASVRSAAMHAVGSGGGATDGGTRR